ncbi:hypothetical protein, partial [Roseicella aquatilis]
MVYLRPGRTKLGLRLASRRGRDEAFFAGDEAPPPRRPKPVRPATVITEAEEAASHAAWLRARLHQRFRGAVSWTEAAGLGLYGALLLLLLGRHQPDGPQEGLPLRDATLPFGLRWGGDPAAQRAEAGGAPPEAGDGPAAMAVADAEGMAAPRMLLGGASAA